MFAKLSLASFVYNVLDVFCFPDQRVKDLLHKNKIIKYFVYLLLTNTYSAFLQFIFISYMERSVSKEGARKLMFEIAVGSKTFERLNRSHEYFDLLQARDKKLKTKVDLYEFEAIDNPIMILVNVNPKQYYKNYKGNDSNKRHTGVRKCTVGINSETSANKILSLQEYEENKKLKPKKMVQNILQDSNSRMMMKTISKSLFARFTS